MEQSPALKTIARIRCGFPTKFGIPRQSGLVQELNAQIIFEPEYRNPDAVRGLEEFSHVWLIWQFSEAVRENWTATVRPPRLGGNKRMGVFATRSPFRPNPIGLSSVRLNSIEIHPQLGPVLHVAGADLMDGTPIYDIKPYLSFTDSHRTPTAALLTGTCRILFRCIALKNFQRFLPLPTALLYWRFWRRIRVLLTKTIRIEFMGFPF